MTKAREKLAPDLFVIFEQEIERGNSVERVDEPAGTKCPLAVIMRAPLRYQGPTAEGVEYWENRDPHYPIQGGYVSKKTGHVIAGPLNAR